MTRYFLGLVDAARALNSKVFSLPRLELLSALESFGPDGALYRDLKAGLGLGDGALISNLRALEKMEYVRKTEVTVEGKKLDAYAITPQGQDETGRVRDWLRKWAGTGNKEVV